MDECHYDDEIVPVLKGLGCERVLILSGTNTDSGKTHKGASFPGLTENFTVDKTALFPALSKARVTKVFLHSLFYQQQTNYDSLPKKLK